jgi:hypothetical protein
MAKQFDNSFFLFAKPVSFVPHALFSGGILMLLAIGLVTAVASANWPLVAVVSLAIVGVAAYSWFSFERARGLAALQNRHRIAWASAEPEIQRQNLDLEVSELSRILEVEPDQVSDLRSAYIVAEDLALRHIQTEEHVPVLRHISIGGVSFDAAMVLRGTLICCDVIFLVAPEVRQERIDAMVKKITAVGSFLERDKVQLDLRHMLVLVTQLTDEDRDRLLRTHDTKRFQGTPVDIDIRLLDFEELQKLYVTES